MPSRQPVQLPSLPPAWAKYLDPTLPAEALSVSGVGILLQVADPALRHLVREHWGAFAQPLPKVKAVQAVLQFSDGSSPPLPRLRKWHSFVSEHFVFLSDGKRYLLTGYLYGQPWQVHCRSLPDWNPEFVYYYVLEPILLDLLKKSGVLVWHSAAVSKGGAAVLLPGVSGSGKSTTTLNLLSLGYRFLADDIVLLRARTAGVEATGYETGLFLTDRSLQLLPEWTEFKQGRARRKGRRWKYQIDLTSRRPGPKVKPPLVKVLLFPQVTRRRATHLEPLSEAEALLECLGQTPKEFPASILGRSALQSQFEIYASLVRSARCYRIHLGADQEQVRAVLSSLELSGDE